MGDASWPGPRPAQGAGARWVLLVVLVATLARFVGLERSPPGFYIDEAAGAAHALCIAREGRSAGGEAYPLFFPVHGSFHTPVYVYFSALWLEAFGSSIASFRAVAALAGALTVVGLFLLGRTLVGPGTGLLVALAAALSPPLFHFGRIAWDPPLAACLLVWAVYLLFAARSIGPAIVSGVLFAAATYAYPPTRVQVLLLLPVLLVLRRRHVPRGSRLAVGLLAGFGLTVLPLVQTTLAGRMQNRYGYVGILTPDYAARAGETPVPWFLLRSFGENLLLHFSPSYLLLRGDPNPRHSSHFGGELGWVDDLALIGGLALLVSLLVSRWRGQRREADATASLRRKAIVLALSGIATGVVPSALTWERLPHALRSIGAWPFVALLSGTLLAWWIDRFPRALPLVAGLSLAFAAAFGHHYFTEYSRRERHFDASLVRTAAEARTSGDWDLFLDANAGYGRVSLRYYLMHYAGDTCSSSRERLHVWSHRRGRRERPY